MNKRCARKEPDDFIFDNQGLQINDFDKCYKEAVDFAGVEVEITNEKGMKEMIRPQYRDLRHVGCTNMIDSGLVVEEVARIMGHTSTIMIQKVYNNRSKESTQLKQAKLMEDGMNKILGV